MRDSAHLPSLSLVARRPLRGLSPWWVWGGWTIWAAFAVAIAVALSFKSTRVQTVTGEVILARSVEHKARAVLLKTREGDTRRVALKRVSDILPYAGRSVTPEYRRASELWRRAEPLYTQGVHGFLYLPQAALLFTPFALLPVYPGELAWRLAGIAACAAGVWLLCGRLFPSRRGVAFAISSFLTVPAAVGSAINGQSNLLMAGLFGLGAAALMDRRWWLATLWLLFALACKPTAIVMILLVGAVHLRPMSWRLALGLVAFLLLPFAHPDPVYVLGQYRACVEKMLTAAAPTDRFQDIRGMLLDFGLALPEAALTALRALAALGTLGLCLLGDRRTDERSGAAYLLAFGAIYLMLFNPRSEGVSYVLLGPVIAIWAARAFLDRRWLAALPLAGVCLLMQFSMQVAGRNYWVRPLATIAFAIGVSVQAARGRRVADQPGAVAQGKPEP